MNEVGWQSKIVKAIKADGGHARKSSNAYATGVLDLTICTITDGMFSIEMKLEKDLKQGFNRTIAFTEGQKAEAHNLNKSSNNGVAWGLVVCQFTVLEVYLIPVVIPEVGCIGMVSGAMINPKKHSWKNVLEYGICNWLRDTKPTGVKNWSSYAKAK